MLEEGRVHRTDFLPRVSQEGGRREEEHLMGEDVMGKGGWGRKKLRVAIVVLVLFQHRKEGRL